MNRKKRVAFERVARQYRNYQRELAMLKKEEHQQEWQTMAMQALEENIAMTERTLSQIRLKHGEKAEQLTREWLIERKTQTEIASEAGISERHLRRLLEAYLNDALGEDE